MSAPDRLSAIKLVGAKKATVLGGDTNGPFDATDYVRRAPVVIAELPEVRALVAAALQRAAERCGFRDHTESEYETDFDRGYDQACDECAAIVLSEISTDHAAALEEVERLRAERDEWKRLYWLVRSFAVHDDDCTMNRHPHYRDCSCGLRAALTTPEEPKP